MTRRRGRRCRRLVGASLAGALLAVTLTGCFSAPPQIISLEPNRGSTSVPADAPVQVVFDRPVTHASVAGRFLVSPAIPGCDLATVFAAPSTAACWVHWLDAAPGFELLHQGAVFRPSTRYTFTLAGGFEDPQGDTNGLDHHWDLTTAAAPGLLSSSPADHASDVALDAPLALSFSAPMDAPSTAAAISLEPAVARTRVVRSSSDHNRFVILPGALLDPAIDYTISVARSARGEDAQFLVAPLAVHFTTSSVLASAHALVLAGIPGEGSTQVIMPALAPATAGEPIAAPLLLQAPRCTAAGGCGTVPAQAPLQTYSAAAISPDGTRLAVVVEDERRGSSDLVVIDTVTDSQVADVPGGVMPSWSPGGTELAFGTAGQVEVLDAPTAILAVVATATTMAAPPLWTSDTTLVISAAAAAGLPASVELVDRQLGARYALPGAPPGSIVVAVSPAGSRIALATADGSAVLVPAAGAAGGAQRLNGRLQPIGFAAEGTLVAIASGGDTTQLVRISTNGGDSTTINLGEGTADLQTVRVAPDGRRLVCLAVDGSGVRQAFVANADGSDETPMTRFLAGGLQAQAVGFSA